MQALAMAGNSDYQLIDEKEVKATDDEKYTLKVVAYDSWILIM